VQIFGAEFSLGLMTRIILATLLLTAPIAHAELSMVRRDFSFPFMPRSPQAFIRYSGGEVLLPVIASNYQFIADSSHRIAAISYHAVSNYDSVAVVAEVDGSLLILPDIWLVLEPELLRERIIPSSDFSHEYLRATSMTGHSLHCTFSAHGGEREFSCTLTIDIAATRDGTSLRAHKET
jgi:hypothetical protein